MKKTTVTLILASILAIYSTAQVNLSIETGANFKTSKPIAGLSVGAIFFEGISINGGFIQHLSSNVDKGGNVAYLKVGAQKYVSKYLFVQPEIGYSFTTRSSDNKELNESGEIYSLTIGKQMKNFENGQLFLSGHYTDGMLALSIGLRFSFIRYRNEYCR